MPSFWMTLSICSFSPCILFLVFCNGIARSLLHLVSSHLFALGSRFHIYKLQLVIRDFSKCFVSVLFGCPYLFPKICFRPVIFLCALLSFVFIYFIQDPLLAFIDPRYSQILTWNVHNSMKDSFHAVILSHVSQERCVICISFSLWLFFSFTSNSYSYITDVRISHDLFCTELEKAGRQDGLVWYPFWYQKVDNLTLVDVIRCQAWQDSSCQLRRATLKVWLLTDFPIIQYSHQG